MKTISGKRMSALLQRKGWYLVRTTGSHHIFVHPGSNLRISVPVHGNHDLKAGLQRTIMRQADLTENDIRERA
uniref:Predicted RNA binding protein YcfA, dsRBD-like fold, HicA-like mRNA interferase family n=1 Tax=Candidatus Kentrum sp. FM TaxID=2126340 RepID=A0A450W970_9GAMM|nr:MAG: Predicted RNA binding protein YcfA, dsRBD-like fold, HicA-like mRNA interferase family [Candidatus Kentron sp. FM]VFJ61201.1 MAG: Predicted RNA binding protein YcfA, dsRBD-like fold, HicA-like mRNA interferase family [Candidatus Kentron sp. FM]VFK13604.1 MAG: Predicted RNA binding protein YcfA, dsRBD-like fold, HicA-like mRNA interferase family [Candidatus Kentron sp. FM]